MENTSCLDGLEPSDRHAVVSVAIAEAAALHDEVIDGVVQGRWGLRGRAGREAGAALPLQQPHPQVGDLQLRLGLCAVRVLRRVRRRQGSEDHLGRETQRVKQKGGYQPAPWCEPRGGMAMRASSGSMHQALMMLFPLYKG